MKDSADFSIYFDNLDSLIEDEKKPVTYRSFAVEFCLQVNVSKQVLGAYYEKNHQNGKRPLCAKYCIGGFLANCLPDVEQIGISVVDENELKNAREKFSKITFEHIYSLSKAKVAMENLTAIDMMQQKDHPHSINKYSNLTNSSVRVSNGETTHPPPSMSDPKKPCGVGIKPSKALPKEEQAAKLDTTNLKKINKSSLAAAFAQQSSTKDTKQETLKPDNDHPKQKDNKVEDKKGNNAKKGIFNYFAGKAADKAPPSGTRSPSVAETPAVVISKEDVPSADKQPAKRFKISQSPPPKVEPEKEEGGVAKKASQKRSKASQKDKQSKERKKSDTKKGQKLRRRIQQVSDSESEPEREPEDDEPMETASPAKPAPFNDSSDDEIIPPTPKLAASCKTGRKRVLKQISKTHMDESGYIVTKKEYEAQSESDDEPVTVEETPPPAAERKVPAPCAASPPLKRKQASIMSFFGKQS